MIFFLLSVLFCFLVKRIFLDGMWKCKKNTYEKPCERCYYIINIMRFLKHNYGIFLVLFSLLLLFEESFIAVASHIEIFNLISGTIMEADHVQTQPWTTLINNILGLLIRKKLLRLETFLEPPISTPLFANDHEGWQYFDAARGVPDTWPFNHVLERFVFGRNF